MTSFLTSQYYALMTYVENADMPSSLTKGWHFYNTKTDEDLLRINMDIYDLFIDFYGFLGSSNGWWFLKCLLWSIIDVRYYMIMLLMLISVFNMVFFFEFILIIKGFYWWYCTISCYNNNNELCYILANFYEVMK